MEESTQVLSQPGPMAAAAEEPPSSGLLRPDHTLWAFGSFEKSGAPSRFFLLSEEDEAWRDLPFEVLEKLEAGFLAGKSWLEVPMGGKSYLFDFLSMSRIDLVTGGKKWICWIDVDGHTFFPRNAVEIYVEGSQKKIKLCSRVDESVSVPSQSQSSAGVKRCYVDCKKEVSGMEASSAGFGKQRLHGALVLNKMPPAFKRFKKSGAPSRFLLLSEEEEVWMDIPFEVFEKLEAGFVAGKSWLKVSMDGKSYFFDFLCMSRIDLVTRGKKWIGWIDVDGQFFFPINAVEECVKRSQEKRKVGLRVDESVSMPSQSQSSVGVKRRYVCMKEVSGTDVSSSGFGKQRLHGALMLKKLPPAFERFKKSGAPSRFLLLSEEEEVWRDVPFEVFEKLEVGFVAGKSWLKVSMDGKSYLFDFLSMSRMDLVTGGKKWIGWIDVDGQIFFPRNAMEEYVKWSQVKRKLGLRVDESISMPSQSQSSVGVKRSYVGCMREVSRTEVSSADFGKQRLHGALMLKKLPPAFERFKKSGAPSRFLLLSEEEEVWMDVPFEVFEKLEAGFVAGKSWLKVYMDRKSYLFDFLSMSRMDLVTGGKKWIGWIDVDGQSFFPMNAVEEYVNWFQEKRKLGLRVDESVSMPSQSQSSVGVKRPYVDCLKEVSGTEVSSAGFDCKMLLAPGRTWMI